jgi:phosphate starvation-inducible protein PhoH
MARRSQAVNVTDLYDDDLLNHNKSKRKASQSRNEPLGNTLKIKLDHMATFDPLTDNQKTFYEAYRQGDYFIALHGVAGTGKSFIALYKALEEVLDKGNPFEKVIIVRSAVQSRDMGHLPGSIDEKMEIYQQPYRQICHTLIGRSDAYQRLVEQGYIEFVSTSFIRGMSFDNCIILVDEMQNMTFEELDTVMTRVGHRSKIIWCGDYRQTDLKKNNDKSGLLKFFDIAAMMGAFTKIEFTIDDIVRSSLVKDYIIAKCNYDETETANSDKNENVRTYRNKRHKS